MLNGIEVRPLRRDLKHINKKSYSNLSKFVHRKIFSIIGLYLFGKKNHWLFNCWIDLFSFYLGLKFQFYKE